MAVSFWRYFRRKAGGPARLRSASVVQSCFILDGFSICFRILKEFRRRLKNKTIPNYNKLVTILLGPLQTTFFGFKALQQVDVERCSKNVFWIDCFRRPEGPAETIQYARKNKKAVRNTQLRSNDAWLG